MYGKCIASNVICLLAVSKVLIALTLWNLRDFETASDTLEKHGIRSQDL